MLSQEERQQHEHAAVVNDPPDVDVALGAGLAVAGKQGDVFGHEQRQVSRGGHSHCVCRKRGGAVKSVKAGM